MTPKTPFPVKWMTPDEVRRRYCQSDPASHPNCYPLILVASGESGLKWQLLGAESPTPGPLYAQSYDLVDLLGLDYIIFFPQGHFTQAWLEGRTRFGSWEECQNLFHKEALPLWM